MTDKLEETWILANDVEQTDSKKQGEEETLLSWPSVSFLGESPFFEIVEFTVSETCWILFHVCNDQNISCHSVFPNNGQLLLATQTVTYFHIMEYKRLVQFEKNIMNRQF